MNRFAVCIVAATLPGSYSWKSAVGLKEEEWVPVPGYGRYPKSCLHQIESGAMVGRDASTGDMVVTVEGREVDRHPACPHFIAAAANVSSAAAWRPPSGDSPIKPFEWKAWTEATTGNSSTSSGSGSGANVIVEKSGSWSVPGTPVNPDLHTLFYMGQGVMPLSDSGILQTVLQWGYGAPSGGGQYWALASWYVSTGGGYFTPLLEVGEGTQVQGQISALGDDKWLVKATSNSTGQSVNFTSAQPSEQFNWAYNMLESFNLEDCSEYPAAPVLAFTDLALKTSGGGLSPSAWMPRHEVPYPLRCKEKATSSGFDNTVIHWNGL